MKNPFKRAVSKPPAVTGAQPVAVPKAVPKNVNSYLPRFTGQLTPTVPFNSVPDTVQYAHSQEAPPKVTDALAMGASGTVAGNPTL